VARHLPEADGSPRRVQVAIRHGVSR